MTQPFKPAWWLKNRHLQTLWPTLCRRRISGLVYKRERLELNDGDFLDLDWVGTAPHSPIVMILPGLEGSSDSPYVQGMLNAIQQCGWRALVVHFRGCSGELNRLARAYHAGDTADVAAVVRLLIEREPQTAMAAVGFSLGGNILLKWLGETAQHNPLQAAVAISVPFVLEQSVRRMNQGFSRIYQLYLLHCLTKKVRRKFAIQPSPIVIPARSALRSIYEFDNQVTAQLHGFVDAQEYYAKSSSRPYLAAIGVPTLLVQAKDDPFMNTDLLPTTAELALPVQLELYAAGGHLGFIAGNGPWRIRYWLEERVPAFLANYLQ